VRRGVAIAGALAVMVPASWAVVAPAAEANSPDVVISQVYGGGGNPGAQFTNDFVEVFNRGSTTVSLAGMSVQYASSTGTGNFGSNPVTALSGNLAPGRHYLVQLAAGPNGSPLPMPDAIGTAQMSGTAGKVALVASTTGLACNGGSTACSQAQLALITDLVGYGSATNFYEGSGPAPTLSNARAAIRRNGGCYGTDDNSKDFVSGAPDPRNTASPPLLCIPGAPVLVSATPGDGSITVAWSAPVSDGGRAILHYEYRLDGGGWMSLGTASPADITGLTNGTTYSVELRAVNGAGPGPASNAVSVTPIATPLPTAVPPVTPAKKKQTGPVPPKRIKRRGVTVLTRKNAKTSAGLRIKTKVKGKAKRGKKAIFKIIRGKKGKVSARTFGKKRWRLVLVQSAPATDTFNAYRLRTVYVNRKRR